MALSHNFLESAIEMALMVWVPAYGIRRGGGFDYRIGPTGQGIRWGAALACLAGMWLGATPWIRVSSGVLFLAFVAWPNLAWYLMAAAAWIRRVPVPPPQPAWEYEPPGKMPMPLRQRKGKDPTRPLGL